VIEGYFPSARAHLNEAAIEEERRLMYVAATRAKDHLILCYPAQEEPPAWSTFHGSAMGYGGNLSSFIRALPEEVAEFCSFKPIGRRYATQFPVQESSLYQDSYRDSSNLRSGDRVNHPAFGQGVVSKIMDKEKVEVLFRDVGRKLLHLEYTTLEKI
jgi:DNA helicase-2/ATP-dependent DNA helicase PcrA